MTRTLHNALADTKGTAPVIGIIIMLGFVTVTGAGIAAIALPAFADATTTADNPTFSYDYNATSDELTVTHTGSEEMRNSVNVHYLVNDSYHHDATELNELTHTPGDTITLTGIEPGDEITVIRDDTSGHETISNHTVTN